MVGNFKIPKRVGAVKLPKKVRRKAKKAIKAAASPLVRDFATAAMAAAGRVRRERGGAREGEPETRFIGGEAHIRIDGNKVAEAIRTAAIDGFRRFLEGLDQGLREVGGKDDPQPEPQAGPGAAAKPRRAAKARPAAKPKPAAKSKPAAKPKPAAKAGPAAKPKPKPKPAAKPRARKAPPAAASPRSPGPGA